MDLRSVVDVFTDEPIDEEKYDVDHFIPWSFVMNDELWNLMPMDSSLNSAKNNRLPHWKDFFIRFARNQYIMYQMIHEREGRGIMCGRNGLQCSDKRSIVERR